MLGIGFCAWTNKWYVREAAKHGGIAPAEARLPPAFYGAISVPFGMFFFAWTNYNSIHWIVPVLAGVPFGFGFTVVFLVVTNVSCTCCQDEWQAWLTFRSIWSTATQSLQRLYLLQTLRCGLCLAPRSRFSLKTCTRTWAYIGPQACRPSSRWSAFHSPSFSTDTAPSSDPSVSTQRSPRLLWRSSERRPPKSLKLRSRLWMRRMWNAPILRARSQVRNKRREGPNSSQSRPGNRLQMMRTAIPWPELDLQEVLSKPQITKPVRTILTESIRRPRWLDWT
jgi:hypothetical protein